MSDRTRFQSLLADTHVCWGAEVEEVVCSGEVMVEPVAWRTDVVPGAWCTELVSSGSAAHPEDETGAEPDVDIAEFGAPTLARALDGYRARSVNELAMREGEPFRCWPDESGWRERAAQRTKSDSTTLERLFARGAFFEREREKKEEKKKKNFRLVGVRWYAIKPDGSRGYVPCTFVELEMAEEEQAEEERLESSGEVVRPEASDDYDYELTVALALSLSVEDSRATQKRATSPPPPYARWSDEGDRAASPHNAPRPSRIPLRPTREREPLSL